MKLINLYERLDTVDGTNVVKLLGLYENEDGDRRSYLIGVWNNHEGAWTPFRAVPENTVLCQGINAKATQHVKLCYNCKGLKRVRVKYGRMLRLNVWQDRDCPTCKGTGVTDRHGWQGELPLDHKSVGGAI